jgi:hypothetical protein
MEGEVEDEVTKSNEWIESAKISSRIQELLKPYKDSKKSSRVVEAVVKVMFFS